MSNAFEEIDDGIGQLDWYLMPDDLQRMLPFLIAVSQKPVILRAFGSISCEREDFKKVSQNVFISNPSGRNKTDLHLIPFR